MRYKIEHQWEQLDDSTFRCKVFKGWMFKVVTKQGVAMSMIQDSDHEWVSLEPLKPVETAKKEPYMSNL